MFRWRCSSKCWAGGEGYRRWRPQVVPTALRGGLQSCGQNCAGAERFIVAAPLFEEFCARVSAVVQKLRQVRVGFSPQL